MVLPFEHEKAQDQKLHDAQVLLARSHVVLESSSCAHSRHPWALVLPVVLAVVEAIAYSCSLDITNS